LRQVLVHEAVAVVADPPGVDLMKQFRPNFTDKTLNGSIVNL
jgi:hypothetical protein